MNAEIERRLWLVLTIGLLFYLGLSIYSNPFDLREALHEFHWALLPFILIVIFIGYLFRLLRWFFYLNRLNIKIEKKKSFLIFFSGLSMSVTPVKSGELIKSFFLKKETKVGISESSPIIFAERFTDMVGMTALAICGLISLEYGYRAVSIPILFIFLSIILIQNQALCKLIISFLDKIPKIGNKINFTEMYESSYILLSPKPLIIGVFLSTISWFLECYCFYLVLTGLNVEFSMIGAMFIFAFSSVVGMVSMLPGGLGTTEGSILGLLILEGVSKSSATAAILLIRFCTLWFAVVIGLIALRYVTRNRVSSKYHVS